MNYGIFRIAKLKKVANLVGSLMHAFREQETFNADPDKLKDNVLFTPDAKDVESTIAKYNKLKPTTGKIRADVVSAIEVLVTASPERMQEMTKEQREDYLKKSLDFCNKEFGEGNLLHAQIHNDETTAHLTAFYIPVIEKPNKKGVINRRLNASSLLGGRKEFSDRQTRFYEQVSKNYGLERGEIGSKATHKRVQEWYKELDVDSRTANSLLDDLKRSSVSEVKVEVEQPVKNVLGIYTSAETVQKTVGLGSPKIDLADLDRVLSPYLNSNAKMKRNEKAKLKHEARKELEEELKGKIQQTERDRADAETQLQSVVWQAYDYYRHLAFKLNLPNNDELVDVGVDELEQAILDRVDELKEIAVENQRALKLEKNVNAELDRWVANRGGKEVRAFSTFDEYKKHFDDLNSDFRGLREENEKLQAVRGLKQRIERVLSDVREIIGATAEDGLESVIKRLIDYVKDMSKPDKIKAMYEEQCEMLIDKYRDSIISSFNMSADNGNSWNTRASNYNSALSMVNKIVEYVRFVPVEVDEAYRNAKEAMERDQHLANIQRPKMRM